jgi:(R,R)-butanediol dehydrogenase/meso-butanediol dehydrogenase/diacetyl reductase
MSGRVAEVGAGVAGWQVGDQVPVMSLDWCDECTAAAPGTHTCATI